VLCLGRRKASVWDDLLHILFVHGVANDLAGSCLVKLAQSHAFGVSPGLPKDAIDVKQEDVKQEDVKEEHGEEEDGDEAELAPAHGVKWVREMDDQLRRGYMLFREWCRKHGAAASGRHRASPMTGGASVTDERGSERHTCLGVCSRGLCPGTEVDGAVAEPWTHKEVHYSRTREYPHMGGKAATVRLTILYLHTFLTEITRRGYIDAGLRYVPVGLTPWFGMLCACVHNLASYIHGVSTYPVLLEPDQVQKLVQSGTNFVVFYKALAAQQFAEGSTHFKVRPKLHFLLHVQLKQGRLNPKAVSCWNDETFIGNVTGVAAKTSRLTMSLRTLLRYLQRLANELRCQP
jgi:hypothetical protein